MEKHNKDLDKLANRTKNESLKESIKVKTKEINSNKPITK